MDDLEAAEQNATTFPVADMGHGEHVATLRIITEAAGLDVLHETLRAVALSTSPHLTVEVIFGSTVPPPLLVTLDDVARCLSVPTSYVRELVKFGWLTPIGYRASDDQNVRYAAAEKAIKTGKWRGWDTRFEWEELVAFMGWVREHEHLPTYQAPMPRRLRRWAKKTSSPVEIQPDSVSSITRRVMRDARNDDGSYQYLSVKEIHRRVDEWVTWKDVPYATVVDAIRGARKKGQARGRSYKATHRNGAGRAYRWVTDEERKRETFEVRYERPPQEDEDEPIVADDQVAEGEKS